MISLYGEGDLVWDYGGYSDNCEGNAELSWQID